MGMPTQVRWLTVLLVLSGFLKLCGAAILLPMLIMTPEKDDLVRVGIAFVAVYFPLAGVICFAAARSIYCRRPHRGLPTTAGILVALFGGPLGMVLGAFILLLTFCPETKNWLNISG